jgi:hypothetical protein
MLIVLLAIRMCNGSRIGRLAALARIENRAKRPSGAGFHSNTRMKKRITPWSIVDCAEGQCSVCQVRGAV